MFAGSNKVMYMDADTEDVMTATLDTFFTKYCYNAKFGSEESSIDMTDMNIKITDLYGWTNIKSVYRYPIKDIKFTSITIADGIFATNEVATIILHPDTIIPFYNPYTEPKIGFHGERIHEYKLKSLKEILNNTDDDYCFLRMLVVKEDKKEYTRPMEKDIKFDLDIDDKYYYKISTKSKLCNINNIQMYTP